MNQNKYSVLDFIVCSWSKLLKIWFSLNPAWVGGLSVHVKSFYQENVKLLKHTILRMSVHTRSMQLHLIKLLTHFYTSTKFIHFPPEEIKSYYVKPP